MFEPTTTGQLAIAYGAAAFFGYLLGSVPFGLILTRAAGFGDIRSMGSGNIGATNVLRTGKKSLAVLTLLLDIGKGAVPVLVASALFPPVAVIAGAAAFLGHLYPVWLGFRGGKGVATFLGVTLAIGPLLGLAIALTWLLTAAVFRISSLAALVAAAAAPAFAWFLAPAPVALLLLAMAIAIFVRHVENIRRIIGGEEPRIGRRPRQD